MDTIRRSITMQRSPAALGLLAALALAGCGGGGPGGSAGPGATQAPGGGAVTPVPGGAAATQGPGADATVDACSLLTEADIEAVTGATVDATTSGPQFGIFESGCEWNLSNDEAMVPPTIALGVLPSGGSAYYETYFEPFNAEYGYEAVDGVGDVAVDAEAGSLLVVSGDVFFNIQYIGLTADDTAIATELAKKVVANL